MILQTRGRTIKTSASLFRCCWKHDTCILKEKTTNVCVKTSTNAEKVTMLAVQLMWELTLGWGKSPSDDATHQIVRQNLQGWGNSTKCESTYPVVRQLTQLWGNLPNCEATYPIVRQLTQLWGNLPKTKPADRWQIETVHLLWYRCGQQLQC